MRGKVSRPRAQNLRSRITPAYAGKSTSHFSSRSASTGSPPRMRGKVAAVTALKSAVRITPAYAGKSTRLSLFAIFSGDHPRVCGEKKLADFDEDSGKGSPPRMRGKGAPPTAHWAKAGITPAYAGKRISGSRTHRHSRDHPRVCGEKKDNPDEWSEVQGSPPRMRGKVEKTPSLCYNGGITPAYAGKSSLECFAHACHGDHPRVCGEKQVFFAFFVFGPGSPPRMRGKVVSTPASSTALRITPAYAGKSILPSATRWPRKDHPRVCGEKNCSEKSWATSQGSPPRMRGKGRRSLSMLSSCWITPAYAGKSFHSGV